MVETPLLTLIIEPKEVVFREMPATATGKAFIGVKFATQVLSAFIVNKSEDDVLVEQLLQLEKTYPAAKAAVKVTGVLLA